MSKKIAFFLVFWGSALCFFPSCETPTNNSCATDFDQLALLENIGNNIILPAYSDFAIIVDSLNVEITNFTTNPTTTTLNNARNVFQSAWNKWQSASIFEFGPAATEELRTYMNNFPVFEDRLNDAINTGTYDLTTEAYSYTRGFPAIDYLLYGVDSTDSAIIIKYTSASDATNRKQYLTDVVSLILQKANSVYDAWKPTGANYLNTFVSTKGVSNGKPLSDLVNQLNQAYEVFKNNKLGTPISAKTGYLPLLPQNVEALYSRKSLNFAITAVEASKNTFMGFANGINGVGLDDFIKATGKTKGNKALEKAIIEQYDLTINSLNALAPNNLYHAINNNLSGVQTAYANAQNQVVQLKTDMPSALCISITYIDNVDDGD